MDAPDTKRRKKNSMHAPTTSAAASRPPRGVDEACAVADIDVASARLHVEKKVSSRTKELRRMIRQCKARRKEAEERGIFGRQTVIACDNDIELMERELDELKTGVVGLDMNAKVDAAVSKIAMDASVSRDDHARAVMALTSTKMPELRLKSSHGSKDSNRAKRRRPHTSRSVRALHTGTSMSRTLGKDEFEAEFLDKPAVVYMIRQEACVHCGGALHTSEYDVQAVCVECGHSTRMLQDARGTGENYSSGDDSQLRSCYKRRNHFRDWMKKMQAKERITIPPETLARICEHIRSMGVESAEEMRSEHVLTAMKTLGLPHLYEHKQLVLTLITNKRPPQLSAEQEEKLMTMFLQTLPAFQRCAPEQRKNFLSYSFVMHNLLLLLGLPHYASEFVLLKGSDKLSRQDAIWRDICRELGWRYIPTI